MAAFMIIHHPVKNAGHCSQQPLRNLHDCIHKLLLQTVIQARLASGSQARGCPSPPCQQAAAHTGSRLCMRLLEPAVASSPQPTAGLLAWADLCPGWLRRAAHLGDDPDLAVALGEGHTHERVTLRLAFLADHAARLLHLARFDLGRAAPARAAGEGGGGRVMGRERERGGHRAQPLLDLPGSAWVDNCCCAVQPRGLGLHKQTATVFAARKTGIC